MPSNPLVSIVIPTYNHRQYVTQTVDSCLGQTYRPIEVIVVDDGSTDGTGELLQERYGDRIRYIRQENQGPAVTRNTGTHAAQGEFIHYCDADDQLLPEKVERCARVLLAQPDVGLVYTHADYVEADGRTIIPREKPELPSGYVFCELLAGPAGNFVTQCTPLIRRQAVLDVGGFPEHIWSAEDWGLWVRLAARYKFAFINETLALYRVLPNAMHTKPLLMATARLQVVEMARHLPARADCFTDAEYDRFESGRHHQLAIVHWQLGQRAKAREAFRRAMELDPDHVPIRRLYTLFSYVLPVRSTRWVESLIEWRRSGDARGGSGQT